MGLAALSCLLIKRRRRVPAAPEPAEVAVVAEAA
jgi:hypothetical protein